MQLELPKAVPMEASGAGDTGSLLGHGCRSLAAPVTWEERRNVPWVGLPRPRWVPLSSTRASLPEPGSAAEVSEAPAGIIQHKP